jgi:hypothetical protein
MRACLLGVCGLALLSPWPAGAQSQLAGAQPVLTPVEAGEDSNPLRVGLRRQRVDLRGPSGFDRLYRVSPGAVIGGVTIKEGGYARISGSTVVVYPRGSYSQVAPGVARADVPAGTMYLQASNVSELIGSPQTRASTSQQRAQSQSEAARNTLAPANTTSTLPRALNARLSEGATPSLPRDADAPTTIVSSAMNDMPSLWDDESYRQRRIGAMIQAAALQSMR